VLDGELENGFRYIGPFELHDFAPMLWASECCRPASAARWRLCGLRAVWEF
jgi:hypothetical protein